MLKQCGVYRYWQKWANNGRYQDQNGSGQLSATAERRDRIYGCDLSYTVRKKSSKFHYDLRNFKVF